MSVTSQSLRTRHVLLLQLAIEGLTPIYLTPETLFEEPEPRPFPDLGTLPCCTIKLNSPRPIRVDGHPPGRFRSQDNDNLEFKASVDGTTRAYRIEYTRT